MRRQQQISMKTGMTKTRYAEGTGKTVKDLLCPNI